MTLEEVTRVLAEAGYTVHEEKPLEYGVQLRLISPQIVNVFDTGTVQVQGRGPVDLREVLLRER